MSVSIYCQAHLNGDSQEIKVSEIIDAFAPYVVESDEFGFNVEFDDLNSSFVFIDLKNKTCSSFSIERPCADDRLYMAIFKCLKLGNFISFWSDGDTFYITNRSILQHIPSDMRDFIASENTQLVVVTTIEDYLREIHYRLKTFRT